MARDRLEYPNKINWDNISKGVSFFRSKGFKYIETPWLAPEEVMRITFKGPYRFTTKLGDLVASGEQSFLYLERAGELKPGKYMTVTPCFRDEEETEFNFKQFVKLELYITDDTSQHELKRVVDLCQEFLNFKIHEGIKDEMASVQVPMEDGSIDIELNGIELGSYGIREHKGHKWIYATGVAEPRFSQAIKSAQAMLVAQARLQ